MLVLSWYHHQPESHQQRFKTVLEGDAETLGLGLLSLILKSLIKSLMQKSDIGAYIRLCIVKAAADVLAG